MTPEAILRELMAAITACMARRLSEGKRALPLYPSAQRRALAKEIKRARAA